MKSFIWGMTCAALLFAVAASAAAPSGSGNTVGLISKVIQDVSHKQIDKDWQKAQKGEPLVSGDRVKTGERSIAIIKFLDNSLVRVRELSEFTISGTLDGGAFLKSVDLQNGVVGFSIQKQKSARRVPLLFPHFGGLHPRDRRAVHDLAILRHTHRHRGNRLVYQQSVRAVRGRPLRIHRNIQSRRQPAEPSCHAGRTRWPPRRQRATGRSRSWSSTCVITRERARSFTSTSKNNLRS